MPIKMSTAVLLLFAASKMSNPMIEPTIAPHLPALPNSLICFVIKEIFLLANMVTKIAIALIMIPVQGIRLDGIFEPKMNTSIPMKAMMGPGNLWMKHPRKPIAISTILIATIIPVDIIICIRI